MTKLRLMSHNQWKNDVNLPKWIEMGADCSAAVRAKGFADIFADVGPDVVGCQEVSGDMADELMRALGAKGMRFALLWGRDTPILYRQDKLELIDSDFRLYPDEVPGFEGVFNNSMTKSWNIAVFRTKECGRLFAFMSTHLWWMSSDPGSGSYQLGSREARVYQIGLAIERLGEYQRKYDCPAVIVGDLNAGYEAPAIARAFELGYVHAHDIATAYADESTGLHPCGPNGFGPYMEEGFKRAIDHILVKGAPEGFVERFERYSPEYYLPLSDHSPVFADIVMQ